MDRPRAPRQGNLLNPREWKARQHHGRMNPVAEADFHKALVRIIRARVYDDVLWYHTANGLWTGEKGGHVLYELGVNPGIPDLTFERAGVDEWGRWCPNGLNPLDPANWQHRNLFQTKRLALELKRDDRAPLSDAQLKVQALIASFHVPFVVTFTLEQSVAMLCSQGFIRPLTRQ